MVRSHFPSTARLLYRSLFLLPAALAISAHAEWKILSSESEPGLAGIEHRHVAVEETAASQRVDFDFAVFPAKSTALRVIDNPDGQSLAAVMKRQKYACGVNGGYFDTDFKPIGLRIADGATFSPLRRARLITGILLQSDRGIDIVRADEFPRAKRIIAAIQAGPFLVEANKRIRGLNDSQWARRTFAAISANDRALLGFCSAVSLSDLADILATLPVAADSRIRRAMNLDGGSSSAFWFARQDGSAFSVPGRKPVRDFVAVVPK
ncbi:MAG TPA: phosphodiester glycosidase family protein [Candidatus Udaeobacter sp.]|nr:phosphodiester glycosidase family protein [Candidatus Udaeobacter sp.]